MTKLRTDEQREQLANRHDAAAEASAKLLTAGRAAMACTVATEPDRTRAAVVKALREHGRSGWGHGTQWADAIENGADW